MRPDDYRTGISSKQNGIYYQAFGGEWRSSGRLLWVALLLVLAAVAFWPSEPAAEADATPDKVGEPYHYHGRGSDNALTEKMIEDRRVREERLQYAMPDAFREPQKVALKKVKDGFVRVAAIQYYSKFGDPKANRETLAKSIRDAANLQAKIIVLPEAAIPGYADMEYETYWSKTPDDLHRDVREVAEPLDGPSVKFFRPLVKELGIYLTVPFIEKDGGKFYNTVVLLAPDGSVALHYRKQYLWTLGDPGWAEKGNLGSPVVDTPYGRIGLMVSYDMHKVLPELVKKKVDIVLHSAALYAMNFGPWLEKNYQKRLKEYGVAYVLANWAFPYPAAWEGYGLSRIVNREGEELAKRGPTPGDCLVISGALNDLKIVK